METAPTPTLTPHTPHPRHFFPSPTSPQLIPRSTPPSPIPRDDIIEGMSASTGSIFERDVQNFDASLTAQEAIQLAVPPVLDEAIEALATQEPANIIVDHIPLQYHLFHPTPQPSHSTPTHNHNHHPFPLLSSPAHPQPSISNNNNNPTPRHHTMSCTSDTATISDPSSPRSLSPTPSYKISRSLVTQLDSNMAVLSNNNKPHPILTEISPLNSPPTSLLPSSISRSPTQSHSPRIMLPHHNRPDEEEEEQAQETHHQHSRRERKTCISFMSYVDILNAERSDSSDAIPPSNSAMNALRMARKSTSSLAKRASSIFSHSPRRHASKKNITSSPTDNHNNTLLLGKAWVDRSRCTSNNTYHSCPTQPSPIDLFHNPPPFGFDMHPSDSEILAAPGSST